MIDNLTLIREKGFHALSKELGATGMAIFIRQLENGSGNYTEEREDLQKDITIDDIVARIKTRESQ